MKHMFVLVSAVHVTSQSDWQLLWRAVPLLHLLHVFFLVVRQLALQLLEIFLFQEGERLF